jgi:hypothetical protein
MKLYKIILLFLSTIVTSYCESPEEELHGVKYANMCEACKILALELQDRLTETGKTHEVIETGYALDGEKKKLKYTKSQLRLIESTENVCDQVLNYNIHKERKDSTRFAKGMSQTFQTLHGLVDKGVKVELGIPLELWDKPSAEVTQLKTQCETLLERHEDDIEDWYFNQQENEKLIDFLCRDRVLAKKDSGCLYEVFVDKKGDDDSDNKDDEDDSDFKKSSKTEKKEL